MNDVSHPSDDHLQELIAGYALGNLSDEEAAELQAAGVSDFDDQLEAFERVAAAIDLAIGRDKFEPMPAALRQKIADKAVADFGTGPAATTTSTPAFGIREAVAWIGMAASLLFAFVIWTGRVEQPAVVVELAPDESRARLLEEAGDSLIVEWAPAKDPFENPVSGDVVWSTARQEGYMRFAGMPVNDPTQEQYQLWIFDPERDEEPIDGGVFNVDASGEVIVPINAKLKVISPAAFAVTIEQPGGVVVSAQDRLPLIAAVQ